MKKKIFIGLAIIVAIFIVIVLLNKTPMGKKIGSNIGLRAPVCPVKLEGLLSYPFMEPKYIAAMTPLGNINPPGHTSPVDHIYFATTYDGKIPMWAPADATITEVTTIGFERTPGKYAVEGYVLRFEVCNGLQLDFANYNDVSDTIKKEIARQGEKNCRRGIKKDGHGKDAEGQCYYHVKIPVKAGEQVGWIWRTPHPEEKNNLTLGFEIWASNYNVDPPSQTNWEYYNDDRYAHIMCPIDLYAGDLKKQFNAKFGRWEDFGSKKDAAKDGKISFAKENSAGSFLPRNGEPLCGQVDQDITGTIQGMWFSKATPKDDYDVKFNGGLAFLHNNVDVNLGEISVGGDLNNGKAGVVFFDPVHNGMINREPSEVKADGKVYCYNANGPWSSESKFLVQLVDNNHLKAEIKTGKCEGNEVINNPFFYER
jgi:hypothetical protein